MGQIMSGPGGCIITNQDGVNKCVPFSKYKPIPASERHPSGELMLEVKGPYVTYRNYYHWMNCQFVPNDDTQIVVTCASYDMGRSMQPFIKLNNFPHGKIHQFNVEHLRTGKLKCEAVSRTCSTTFPKVQVHPDSNYVCFLDSTDVKIFHRTENLGIHSKAYEAGFRRYRSFALSPDGKRSCILSRQGYNNYELLIYGVNASMYCDVNIHCTKLDKDFRGTGKEVVDCRWSPDSSHVAITISTGYLLCVNVKAGTISCNVFSDILPDLLLSNIFAYDFDQRSCYQIMAVGDSLGYLNIINVEDKQIICKSQRLGCGNIDCLVYSPEADLIGIALHDFKLHLCDSNTCDIVYSINMCDDCPYLNNFHGLQQYPMITSMSFSRSGEQLAVCCYDGYLRMWQMPLNLNLKLLCKLQVLRLVQQGDIKNLPLPSALKDYLLPLP